MRKLAMLVSAVASSFRVALAQTPERPLTSFPYTPGLDVNAMDKSGLVVNMPEFERAFSCKPGQPMVGANRCRVW